MQQDLLTKVFGIPDLETTTADGDGYSSFGIILAGLSGFIGQPVYWYLWTYTLPQTHDPFWLRMSASAFCLATLLYRYWPRHIKPYFSAFWIFTISYNLPFVFTYLLIANNFSTPYLLSHFGAIFYLAVLHPSIKWFFASLSVGTLVGAITAFITLPNVSFESFPPEYTPVLLFMVAILMPFMAVIQKNTVKFIEQRQRSALQENRAETYRALSGSIAHEVRSPVTMAGQTLVAIDSRMTRMQKQLQDVDTEGLASNLQRLSNLTNRAQGDLRRGDVVINMILANIRDQELNPASLKSQSVAEVVNEALREYPFRPDEREVVSVELGSDFQARVDASLLIYVLFNLLRNALHYLPNKPHSRISIRLQSHGTENTLLFRDTGPGIAAEQLATLFDSFSTAGKKGGTGLGLAFCKRVMTAFGGDIRCQSVPDEYAEFTLSFPVLTANHTASNDDAQQDSPR